ncbi:MAG TPA: NAD(P)H-dependent oxidoreductase [Tepidisphaeraceae bacterium]|nr:NAD(P)H-dependent oxidoreductase [Tepidisphaeraceae bacterium]
MAEHSILVISGTNRPQANALRIARLVVAHYRRLDTPADLLSMCDLPREIFDPSSYAVKPATFAAIQQRVLDAGGLHIVTPEYNGSFPGILKYFIDMLKFPESFERKPVAFIGEATSVWGALRAVEQLQMVFGYRNAHIYPERVFIPSVKEKLDEQGHLRDASLDERLATQAQGFAEYCHLLKTKPRGARPVD